MRYWCEAMCMASWAARIVRVHGQRDGKQNKSASRKVCMLASVRGALAVEACDGSGRVRAAATAILGTCGGVQFCALLLRLVVWREELRWAETRDGPSRGPARFLVDP